MNGKKARALRKQVANPTNKVYKNDMHNKFTPFNKSTGIGGKQLFTTKLKHTCGRAKYQDLKQLYRMEGV